MALLVVMVALAVQAVVEGYGGGGSSANIWTR
jgi:hypothetical protein